MTDQDYKLSTTIELANIGVAEFQALVKTFPEKAKQLLTGVAPTRPYFIKFIDVQRCVTGVSAEILFEVRELTSFPKEAFSEAEEVINSQALHFFFYHREKHPQYYHLFNLLAVQQVAANYPDYFPAEMGTDTRNWLKNNWRIWADGTAMNCIRYGLLSGFPLEAAIRFSKEQTGTG